MIHAPIPMCPVPLTWVYFFPYLLSPPDLVLNSLFAYCGFLGRFTPQRQGLCCLSQSCCIFSTMDSNSLPVSSQYCYFLLINEMIYKSRSERRASGEHARFAAGRTASLILPGHMPAGEHWESDYSLGPQCIHLQCEAHTHFFVGCCEDWIRHCRWDPV